MSLWEETPTSLTSFAPPSSEVQSSGNFLSRLFKRGKEDVEQSSDSSQTSSRSVSSDRFAASSREVSVERHISREQSRERKLRRRRSLDGNEDGAVSEGNSESPVKLNLGKADLSSRNNNDSGKQYSSVPSKRTLGSVLTRLSAILERRAATPQVYRDSDFKQYWMPDSSCHECYECGDKFTTFRRRHHCRICGQIFCHACCGQELPGKIIGYKGSIRVCNYCYKIVQRYAEKADTSADPKVISEALNKYLEASSSLNFDQSFKIHKKSMLDLNSSTRSLSESELSTIDGTAPFDLTPQKDFVVTDNFSSERKLLVQDSTQLRHLWTQMNDEEIGLEYQSYRIRLRNYQQCIAGNKIVDWLIKQDKVANRAQAIAIGQALLDGAYLDPIHTITTPFRDDFTLYKPTEIPVFYVTSPEFEITENTRLEEDNAPQWFQDIQVDTDEGGLTHSHDGVEENLTISQCYSDLSEDSRGEIKVDERHFDEPLPQQNLIGTEDVIEPIFHNVSKEMEKSMGTEEVTGSWRTLNIVSDDTLERETYEKLQQEHHEHLTMLTKQLLYEDNIPGGWADIIISTVDRVSLFVKPDVKNSSDDMDIRKYIHIKKIPGGTREQTALLHGVIFTKNVAHKKMTHKIDNPSVLLLAGSIEYQRVENKMSYLEPQILQEEEFLRKSIKKITSLRQKPHVLVVEKSVSRLAQNFLLKAGITLIYNVKQSVMERLSRFLVADIVASIDSLVRGVKLGFCHSFSVRSFVLPSGDSKNMIYFDGCATHLGCAITLRGGSVSELKKVKKIIKFMIYASYHSRLEISFCMDEFLKAPMKDDLDLDMVPKGASRNSKNLKELNSANIEERSKRSSQHIRQGSIGKVKPDSLLGDNSHSSRPSSRTEKEHNTAEEVKELHGKDINVNAGKSLCLNSNSKLDESNAKQSLQIVNQETLATESDRLSKLVQYNISTEADRKSEFVIGSAVDFVDQSRRKSDNQSKVLFEIGDQSDDQEINQSKIGAVCESYSQKTCSTPNLNDQDTKNTETSVLVNLKKEREVRTTSPEGRPRSSSAGGGPVVRREKSPAPHRKSAAMQLTDLSDPLNKYQMDQDESIFQSSIVFQEQLLTHRTKFRKTLDNVMLSTSPYIKYNLPYLETEAGSKCELRQYFPEEIYWSANFCLKSGQRKPKSKGSDTDLPKKVEQPSNIVIKEPHEFIRGQLKLPASDKTTQVVSDQQVDSADPNQMAQMCQLIRSYTGHTHHLLAKFRAYGGRINVVEPPNHFDVQSRKSRDNQSRKGKPLTVDLTKGENGVVSEKKIDCLDIFWHQKIAVLFSSFSYQSENHPSPCVYPWVVNMDFYGRNDTTLGGFLERFCFRPSYVCPSDSCSTSMIRHVRRFVHGQGCISLVLKQLEQPIPNGQNCILMWSWCHKCKQVTPVVPISPDTWNLSFSRYLEFRFHGSNFQRRIGSEPACKHSLHHDHFQYFGFKDTVASFKYSTVKIKEIKLPPLIINVDYVLETIQLYRLKDEVKRLTLKITDLFSSVLDCMTKMKAESPSETLVKFITDCIVIQQIEKTRIRDMAHDTQEGLENLLKQAGDAKILTLSETQRKTYNDVEDSTVTLKIAIAKAVTGWNAKLQDVYVQHKKMKQGTGQKKDKEKEPPVPSSVSSSCTLELDDRNSPSSLPSLPQTELDIPINLPPVSLPPVNLPPINPPPEDTFLMSGSEFGYDEDRRKSDFSVLSLSPPISKRRSYSSSDSYTYGVTPGLEAVGAWPTSYSESYVVCHNDEVIPSSSVLEKTEESMTESDDTMVASLPSISMVTDQGHEGQGLKKETELKSLQETVSVTDKVNTQENSSNSAKKAAGEDQADSQAGDKIGAIKKTLMNTIWQGSGAFQLQTPFEPCDHHLLPVCDKVPVIVYDHEPSSVIAYSLSCHDYQTKLNEIQASQRSSKADSESTDKTGKDDLPGMAKRPSASRLSIFKSSGKETPRPDTPDSVRFQNKVDNNQLESPLDEQDTPMFLSSTSETVEKSKASKQTVNHHIELQFSDNTARFYCKVYFADQFQHLRKHIFPDGEEAYIRSLSHCKPWEAKGGKSGSSFCKTDDDRFILKQMSSMEVESFERFGPEYFAYISSVEKQQRPTALAKIVGVYRIGFRNQYTNNAMKQDLLVVENLFYNRSISQTYDLKGSERNRLVKPNRKRDEEQVLLDENFLRGSVDSPLYIMSHSKTMLMLAIGHDSQFLSSNLVMDYSLLVGLDEQKKELVVGIIDYIRTFTWDKKLETILKSNFGGQGKMPTVVSPEVYRTRFLDAMAKYFLPVPDQWTGLGRDIDI